MLTWIAFGLLFLLLLSFAYAAASGAPWVPTWKKDIDRLTDLLDLHPGEYFLELGSGDGRVCLEIAKRTQAVCIGVELSLAQWLVSQVRRMLSGQKNVYFIIGNAFNHDTCNADAVYLFLMPDAYKKIGPKLEKELKSGARVVSYVWEIPGWTPVRVDKKEGAPPLYLYQR